ncbi:uncharacterized protein LOC144876274 [Branchiostoma floridae x Branchiostoma japonicum]
MASRRKKYTQQDMDSALKALQETEGTSVNKTAKEYGIPQSTLYDRVTGKSKERMGRPSILSPEEEGTLVFYAKYLAEKGFPLTVREIKALANEIEKKSAKGRGEEPRFKDSGPGKRWWKGFRGRHPDLNFRSPDQLNKERAAFSTAGVVFEHFERLEEILSDAKAKDKRPHTSSTTATPTAASSAMTPTAASTAMTPTTASSSKHDTTPASASTTACPTCNTPCTACNTLPNPLIQTLIPPEPIPPAKKSSRCNLKRRLTGRVLTHTEVMEETRLKEKEKKEKEERKERRKEEMKKKRKEKEQKELEKRLQKEKKQAESEKKLAEKEERKRKRQEDAEARKKQNIRHVPVVAVP